MNTVRSLKKNRHFPEYRFREAGVRKCWECLPKAEVGFSIPEEEQSLRLLLKEGEQVADQNRSSSGTDGAGGSRRLCGQCKVLSGG